MSIKFKTIFLSVALTGFVFSSATAFAGGIYPGITDPCEQLWVVNDPKNAERPANEGGECIDIPAELKKVKVIFNLDNATTKTSPSVVYLTDEFTGELILDEDDNKIKVYEDGKPKTVMVTEPVGLRHMALLGKVMQYRIAEKGLDPSNVQIVGIFHGAAMSGMKWGLKANSTADGTFPPAPPSALDLRVNSWMNQIFDLKEAGINIQLEVCGVTLKGMQKKAQELELELPNGMPVWTLMDEKSVYGYKPVLDNGGDRRVYVNQGAVARMIDLQRDGFAILQEE